MAENNEFFLPEKVDKQIENVKQSKEGDRLDAEALAHLRSYYQIDAEPKQETLDRIWNRIADARLFVQNTQESEKELSMEYPNMQSNIGAMGSSRPSRPRPPLLQRIALVAAAVFLVALIGGVTIVFYASQHNGGPASSKPPVITSTSHTGLASPTPTTAPSPTPVPLRVTVVDMSVSPASITGMACGTDVTVTYTATIHVVANSSGGTVQFTYTVNNGRGSTPASITFNPGETSKTYTFTWSGALPADHTYPGQGGVQVTSPNQLTSALVAPTGQCTVPSTSAFLVTAVDMSVSPASIAGMACGTNVTVTYTATIHVAANSPGGTVQFTYTVNNGRGSTPASITFSPGQTVQTYTFTWHGALPADHTYPGQGGIQVSSPNSLTSALVKPTGTCS